MKRDWRSVTERVLPYVVAATGGFILAYAFVFFFVFPARLTPQEITVPNVLGLTFDDARQRLGAAGFTAEQGESRFNVGSPRMTVLSQTPAGSATAPHGTKVVLDVSAGQRRVAIPNIVGMTRDQAQLTLEKVGLEVGPVVERESPLPRGEVMATSPLAGAEAILPSTVTLTVSSGPATVAVPDLVGQPLTQARSTLEQLGLHTGRVTVDSAAADPDGTVTREYPAAGSTVEAGASVSLTVAGRIP
ncbi:MAG TPA: PASTA domain-containing protein [Gemmatimonadaceae bacterium]|nr:PASTA domain-containing protein [Gemmatimonadaceae bacterium]